MNIYSKNLGIETFKISIGSKCADYWLKVHKYCGYFLDTKIMKESHLDPMGATYLEFKIKI